MGGAAGALTPASPHLRRERFVFHGGAGEYFGIWIVNVLLTIVTLGIYSAWAKVRMKRYFHGSTTLDGHAFGYHARGGQILIGRLIVLAAITVFNVVTTVAPILIAVVIPLYLFGLPWILNRALRFGARVTSYRNVRFDFDGQYWRAFRIFILMPVAVLLTLGLLLPVQSRMTQRYIAGGHRFGTARFSAEPPLSPYYGAFLKALFFVLATAGVVVALAFALAAGVPSPAKVLIPAAIVVFYGTLIPAGIYYRIATRNIGYSALRLEGGHAFRSTLSPLRMVWILVSNLVVIVLTLGLMLPWARVRAARYTAAHTEALIEGSADSFVDTIAREGSAVAAEFTDIEGIDVGF